MSKNDLNGSLSEVPIRPDQTKDSLEEGESMRWVGFGVEFIGVLGVFTYAGYWADRTLQTSPWLMIIGMSIAFVGMIYLLFKETAHWRK
ncbi:MAG: AtpZ/AtpI family protein [Sedimentisphaerales bacterium]|nr:AtpZ/AtpI family protein [Sedimentisphaerales bacterium]